VDDPLVWFQYPAATRHHLFKDERGSVIAADNGSSVTTMRYDEYGNHDAGATYSGRFLYTGQAWMPELGTLEVMLRKCWRKTTPSMSRLPTR
jgi:hypothetical protein